MRSSIYQSPASFGLKDLESFLGRKTKRLGLGQREADATRTAHPRAKLVPNRTKSVRKVHKDTVL